MPNRKRDKKKKKTLATNINFTCICVWVRAAVQFKFLIRFPFPLWLVWCANECVCSCVCVFTFHCLCIVLSRFSKKYVLQIYEYPVSVYPFLSVQRVSSTATIRRPALKNNTSGLGGSRVWNCLTSTPQLLTDSHWWDSDRPMLKIHMASTTRFTAGSTNKKKVQTFSQWS